MYVCNVIVFYLLNKFFSINVSVIVLSPFGMYFTSKGNIDTGHRFGR